MSRYTPTIPERMQGTPAEKLATAVIITAVEDYKKNVENLLSNRYSTKKEIEYYKEIKRIEKFFLSDTYFLYASIAGLTTNGEKMLNMIKRGIKNGKKEK